jgi:hypothetical protein
MRNFNHGIRIRDPDPFARSGFPKRNADLEIRNHDIYNDLSFVVPRPPPSSSSNFDVSFYVITRACGSTYYTCIMSISLLNNILKTSDSGTFQF